MLNFCSSLKSSLGKKFLMAITGLGLSGFLLIHMSENLLLIAGSDAYNSYSHFLITNPFIYVLEIGLLLMFLVHIFLAVKLTLENRCARGSESYLVTPNGDKGTSFAKKSMIYTGLLILVFLILHLINFKYGEHYEVTVNGVVMRDLYKLVSETFRNSMGAVIWYEVCMIVLGIHLSHGIASTFQSLGINHPRYNCLIQKLSWGLTGIIVGGFMIEPLYFVFTK